MMIKDAHTLLPPKSFIFLVVSSSPSSSMFVLVHPHRRSEDERILKYLFYICRARRKWVCLRERHNSKNTQQIKAITCQQWSWKEPSCCEFLSSNKRPKKKEKKFVMLNFCFFSSFFFEILFNVSIFFFTFNTEPVLNAWKCVTQSTSRNEHKTKDISQWFCVLFVNHKNPFGCYCIIMQQSSWNTCRPRCLPNDASL